MIIILKIPTVNSPDTFSIDYAYYVRTGGSVVSTDDYIYSNSYGTRSPNLSGVGKAGIAYYVGSDGNIYGYWRVDYVSDSYGRLALSEHLQQRQRCVPREFGWRRHLHRLRCVQFLRKETNLSEYQLRCIYVLRKNFW